MNLKKVFIQTLIVISAALCAASSYAADSSIRILMLNSTGSPMPGEDAVKLYSLDGKVRLDGRLYEGKLDIIKDSRGLYVVKAVPIEEYVGMAVASEMGDDGGTEAMKSLAVVTRTFAFYKKWLNTGRLFHMASTLYKEPSEESGVDPYLAYAVKSTRGEVLTFNGLPIYAAYHSTCQGMTELPEEIWGKNYPYLKSVACNSKNAPYEHWQRRYSTADLARKLGVTDLISVTIQSHTVTGRAGSVGVIFRDSSKGITRKDISAQKLRRLLGDKGLPSTDFDIKQKGRYYIFNGRGLGHAVGLSQWGAIEMAWEGKSYREILSHFYPGTELQKREAVFTGMGQKDSAGQ